MRFSTANKVAKNVFLLMLLTLVQFSIAGASYAPAPDPHQASRQAKLEFQNSRIETFTITIPQLGDRPKKIQVYLPPDYDTGEKAYPVIYLGDGEYLFNPPSTAAGDYEIDETLDRLFQEGILEGVIVVGLEHNFDYQWSEYTPWINPNMHDWVKKSNSEPIEGGEGVAYLEFIVHTLKPEIDARYRTLPDHSNTLIGGFCRNSLIPLLGGLIYPNVFSGVMSMSPVVWLAEGGGAWLSDNHLIDFINSSAVPQNVKFYIDIGTEEASGPRPTVRDADGKRITYPQAYLEGAQVLSTTLLENGLPEPNLWFNVVDGVPGNRDYWGDRFELALIWLLEEPQAPMEKPTPSTPATPNPTQPTEPLETSEPVIQPSPTKDTDPGLRWPGFPGFRFNRIFIIGILLGGFVLMIPVVVVIVWLIRKR